MISVRNHQILITLIVAAICAPLVAVEPNLVMPDLRFQISDKSQEWLIGEPRETELAKIVVRGPIRPTHVAEMLINGESMWGAEKGRYLLHTTSGKALSERQKEFLQSTEYGTTVLGLDGDTIRLRLYAVSADDARTMAQAMQEYQLIGLGLPLDYLYEYGGTPSDLFLRPQNYEQAIAEIQEKIVETDDAVKATQNKFEKLKKTVRYLSQEEAKQAISEFNRMLNALDVELSGAEAKLALVEDYTAKYQKTNPAIGTRLDQIRIEMLIELAGVKARRATATALRGDAQAFCELDNTRTALANEQKKLPDKLRECREGQERYEEWIASRRALAPKLVYQNKVTIYPVRVDTSETAGTTKK
ncbi:MAG: hypothetical protein ISS79_09580 [Phycisphaerae bacterium]|nr:hypothetical protein [Phycisphaerae bacterium]